MKGKISFWWFFSHHFDVFFPFPEMQFSWKHLKLELLFVALHDRQLTFASDARIKLLWFRLCLLFGSF
jgi:hypothetical protein